MKLTLLEVLQGEMEETLIYAKMIVPKTTIKSGLWESCFKEETDSFAQCSDNWPLEGIRRKLANVHPNVQRRALGSTLLFGKSQVATLLCIASCVHSDEHVLEVCNSNPVDLFTGNQGLATVSKPKENNNGYLISG